MMTPEDHKKSTRGGEWIGIGLALGVALGLTMDNLAIGIGIGLLVGVVIMGALQRQARNDEP